MTDLFKLKALTILEALFGLTAIQFISAIDAADFLLKFLQICIAVVTLLTVSKRLRKLLKNDK